jgi:hypothetical protein
MTSLNLADNMLCGINKYGSGTYDASGKWPLASLGTAAAVTPVQPCIGIIALANAIPDMGVLTRLDISENGLRVAGTKALTEGLKGNQIMTELNISSNGMGRSGAIALVNAMPDMGVLTSLNLSSNLLKAKGAKIVAGAIKVTKCTTAVVLVPSSCPSDHWWNWNCCCLLLSTGQ